jgi:hypothetical protein
MTYPGAILREATDAARRAATMGEGDAPMLMPGDRLPDLRLASLDGVARDLAEFTGTPLLLYFWGSW